MDSSAAGHGHSARGGAPHAEEVGRVHVPSLHLRAGLRQDHARLLQVRLWSEQRAHGGGDRREIGELGKGRRLGRVDVLPPVRAAILQLARLGLAQPLAQRANRVRVQHALEDAAALGVHGLPHLARVADAGDIGGWSGGRAERWDAPAPSSPQ